MEQPVASSPSSIIPKPPKLCGEDTEQEQLQKWIAAFAHAKSVKGAARLLGATHDEARGAVDRWPQLKAYMPDAKAPTTAELIAEPAALQIVAPSRRGTDIEIASGVARANAQLKSGLQSIGLSQELVNDGASLAAFAQAQFSSLLHLTSGGLARLYLEMLAEVRKLNKDLEEPGKYEFEEEEMLRKDRSEILKAVIQLSQEVRESSMTAAKIEQIKADEKNGKGGAGAGKPRLGAPPLMAGMSVKTTGNAEVKIGVASGS